MTEQEAIRLFEKAHFLKDELDMQSDMNEIDNILTSKININAVMNKIYDINEKHPENVVLYNVIYPPVGNPVPLNRATDNGLINDLTWKKYFLIAKMKAKTFDEFYKEMTNKE